MISGIASRDHDIAIVGAVLPGSKRAIAPLSGKCSPIRAASAIPAAAVRALTHSCRRRHPFTLGEPTVTASASAFTRSVQVFISSSLSPAAQSARLAAVARQGLADLIASGQAPSRHTTIVDGVEGRSEDGAVP